MTPEIKAAWQRAQTYPDDSEWMVLANAYIDAEARAKRAEFEIEHHADIDGLCVACGDSDADIERHQWRLADWREAVIADLEQK